MKLPISMPHITSYQFYSLPLAIIGANKNTENWIYNEFIQLFTSYNSVDNNSGLFFYNKKNDLFSYEPLNDFRIVSKPLIYSENITDCYKIFLESGHYIYDFLDKYYIKSFCLSYNFIHEVLVYGYDDNKKVFYAFGYHGDKLKEFEIPYDEYIAAYESRCKINYKNITIIYSLKNDEYKINIKKIYWYLLDYIEGINTFDREDLHTVQINEPSFGINIYDKLKHILHYQRDFDLFIKIPNIYCLYDHKKFMLERVKYLNHNSQIKCPDEMLNQFKQLEKEAQKIILLSLKINRNNFRNTVDFENLLKHIDIMKENENSLYKKYYEYNKDIFEKS